MRYGWNARQLRLGVRALGSNPSGILLPVAFVGLVIVRSAGLVLGKNTPEVKTTEQRKGKPMNMAKKIVSGVLETAWSLGVSMLAGLTLLT